MLDITPALTQAAPLAAVGFVAGLLNVIAGGGSLLTLPVMLWMGMPAAVANATNRIGLVAQNVAATTAFHQGKRLPWRAVWMLLLPMLPGAALGAWLAIDVDETLFRRILAGVMLFSLWSIWRKGAVDDSGDHPPARHPVLLRVSFFFMGIYAGFIQAGLGFLIIGALTGLGGFDLVRTNAIKVTLVLVVQVASLAIFSAAGTVDWVAGASLALGSTLGAWTGAHLQMAKGSLWVRRAVIVLLLGFTLRLLYEGFVTGAARAGW